MEISTETRLEVNSYMLKHIKTKGVIGYQYFKRMIEYSLEDYKKNKYITNLNLKSMIQKANLEESYVSIQRAMFYFLRQEGIEMPIVDFIVDTVEKIVDENKINLIKSIPIEEEVF